MKYFFILLTLLSPFAQATDDHALFWLERMVKAVGETNYDGVFVYSHDGMMETLRIVHTVDEDGEKERIFSLNGEPREIIRDNQSITYILPDEKAISTSKQPAGNKHFSGFFTLEPKRLQTNYRIILSGSGRVADRMAKVIIFQPKDHYRYGYKLHLDDEYALPLQWDMFDEDDYLISSIMFTRLDVGRDIKDSGPLMPAKTPAIVEKVTAVSSPVVPERTGNWVFRRIPDGFKLENFIEKIQPESKNRIEHYVFGDGIASFSIYVEKTPRSKLAGEAHVGALNAYGLYHSGYQVTSVGEVPSKTLQMAVSDMRLATSVPQ